MEQLHVFPAAPLGWQTAGVDEQLPSQSICHVSAPVEVVLHIRYSMRTALKRLWLITTSREHMPGVKVGLVMQAGEPEGVL